MAHPAVAGYIVFMTRDYEPKPIRFALPLSSKRFIMPASRREMGLAVQMVGLATLIVSGWGPTGEAIAHIGARQGQGERVAIIPYRGQIEQRLVGVYVFRDEQGIAASVNGSRVRLTKESVPSTARVVWPTGRPQQARVVGEYQDRWIGVVAGLLLFGFSFWLRRPIVDEIARQMARTEAREKDTVPDQPPSPDTRKQDV
jgi:hypothetical protein